VHCELASLAADDAARAGLEARERAILREHAGEKRPGSWLERIDYRRGDRFDRGFVSDEDGLHRHSAVVVSIPKYVDAAEDTRPASRRGLRIAGCSLIYFSTYYRVVQFDSGIYPLLLGGVTLVGILLGFLLQLRDLSLLSAGFLVLNVVSNLTYYGVHRPVLGWTLLTLVGLCLTASGILFQMRRAQVRAFVARLRTTLADWD
jgi:hypothetical protein